jgi:hypothetical protein
MRKVLHATKILGVLMSVVSLTLFMATPQFAQGADQDSKSEQDLGKIGAKLVNPISDVWALQGSFNMPEFYDGDVNTGDPDIGAAMVFQPVMPFLLYGPEGDPWRLITRPIIPFIFSEPVPKGFNDFDHTGGSGDIQLPLVLSVPKRIAGNLILGAGPVGLFAAKTIKLGKTPVNIKAGLEYSVVSPDDFGSVPSSESRLRR